MTSKPYLISIFLILILPFISGLTMCQSQGMNPSVEIKFVDAFPGHTFTRPLDLQDPNDGSGELYVVVQRGLIFKMAPKNGDWEKETFLDIEDQIDDRGNEEGLLGLAFHPNYPADNRIFLNYTVNNPDQTHVVSYRVINGQVDPATKTLILAFDQPYSNHNGGDLEFGPDGYLYIGVGDGGSANDPQGHGQNRETLLGNILRIDIDNQEGGKAYAIPADNPYKDNQFNFREEIYAWGLRNPWRMSFDNMTGTLWTGDVGQNRIEEIDTVTAGGNYGWNVMEGPDCFEPKTGCNRGQKILPVHSYKHKDGISVTGGYVYRGKRIPGLSGAYIYADYSSDRVWALFPTGDSYRNERLMVKPGLQTASFAKDAENELFVCSFDGHVYRIE